MSSIKSYIESLNFDYIKTYSGFRGEAFEKFQKECENKINELEVAFKTARYLQQSKIQKEISDLIAELMAYNLRVIDKDGILHKSTKMVAHAQKEDQLVKNIFQALMIKPTDLIAAGCAPVFRDAIVFYSKENKIVGILHFCFSCLYIQDENRKSLELDSRSYSILEKILRSAGHPIES